MLIQMLKVIELISAKYDGCIFYENVYKQKRIKMFLENNVNIANIYFDKYSNLLYDETTIPYISIYYYNPKPYNNETIIIPYKNNFKGWLVYSHPSAI